MKSILILYLFTIVISCAFIHNDLFVEFTRNNFLTNTLSKKIKNYEDNTNYYIDMIKYDIYVNLANIQYNNINLSNKIIYL